MSGDPIAHWAIPTYRSLSVRPLLAGLPPEWAVALGSIWWAVYLLSGNFLGCAIGISLCWLLLAWVLYRDPHSIDVLRRALQLRQLLES